MYSLADWSKQNETSEKMIYKRNADNQIFFMQNIGRGLFSAYRSDDDIAYNHSRDLIKVASTHTSKSITLPVYYFMWENIKFYLRYNFHDWKVSVISEYPLEIDFEDCFKDCSYASCYFEGFRPEWVFGSYFKDNKRFSVELSDNEDLTFFFRKIWYYIRKMEQEMMPISTVIRKTLSEMSEEALNAGWTGDTLKMSLEGVATKIEKSSNKVHNWSYIDTLLSNYLKTNKKFKDWDETQKIYDMFFKDNWDRLETKRRFDSK